MVRHDAHAERIARPTRPGHRRQLMTFVAGRDRDRMARADRTSRDAIAALLGGVGMRRPSPAPSDCFWVRLGFRRDRIVVWKWRSRISSGPEAFQ